MLEIRYNKSTKELTGWWGNRYGNHKVKLRYRPDEAMTMLDIHIPDKPLGAWLYDGKKLVPNPDYVELEPPRDLVAGIDNLKARLDEAGIGIIRKT